MNITCAVVDDEPLALELLESYVRKTPFLTLNGSFDNGVKALEHLRHEHVDILFCDIQMPGINGIELSRLLPAPTRIIFTTAFDQYAVEGFRVNALDYLLKPISYSDFLESVRKAMSWFENAASAPEIKSIFIRSEHRLQQVSLTDINFIEGMKDYIKIYLSTASKPVISQMSMKLIMSQLPGTMFYRVHRSYIVNMANIRLIERNRIVFGDHYIPISDNERDAFFSALSRHSILDLN